MNRVERFWQRGRGGGWRVRRVRRDPLAQTFTVGETTGVFVTSIDVFFQSKDETLPVILEMRTVETGLPTQRFFLLLRLKKNQMI